MRIKNIIITLFILCSSSAYGQGDFKRALFLGNSYSSFNNLPQLVADMADSMGDTLYFERHLPGGATFNAHSLNSNSLGKIMQGDWDYVILQGQSLEFFGYYPLEAVPYPPVGILDSLIHEYSPCGETVFYRTWGRKNGFPNYPYETMDSLIHINYMNHANVLKCPVSPVGEVWKYIRENHPSIELYQSDESHPSLAGSYTAACCFYTTLFRKDPSLITYNSSLSTTETSHIKNAVKQVVFDSLLKWNIGKYDFHNSINCLTSNIDEEEMNPTWQVYPNPATSHLIIESNTHHNNELIQIYDTSGVLLKEVKSSHSHITEINIDDLDSGIYFIRLKYQSNKIVKILKE